MRNQIRTVAAALCAGLLLGAVTTASAASVGVSFAGRDPGFPLDADASAGVVAQSLWNNLAGEPFSSTSYSLLANTGEFTDVKLVYAANDSWHSDGPSVTANDKLMKGIQKMNPDPDTAPINNTDRMIFTITNLPAGTFNVLVYLANNGAGGEVSVNAGGAITYYVSQEASFTGTFVRSTDTTPGSWPVGANYAQFDGVASVNGAITVTVIKNIVDPQVADGGGVAAIQFVQLTGSPLPPNTTACSITTPPTSITNIAGDTATFSVVATSPSRIQWQKNGVDIPGAVNLTYRTPPTVVGDNNATFRAIVYNNVNTNTSASAVLTVLAGLPAVLVQGLLEVQRWDAVTGTTTAEALAVINAVPPVTPSTSFFVGSAAVPDQGIDNFALKISGWFSPTVTGDYHFFIRSDDASALYLNQVAAVSGTNALPDLNTDIPIAEEFDCCDAFIEPDLGDTATSVLIPLQAGKFYGMIYVLKEGTGGDIGQVAWRLSTDTNAAATLTPIGAKNIYLMASPSGKTAVITTQPTAVTTIEGQTATFNVVVTTTPTAGAASIQWLKNGTPIPGATAATYKTPILTAADNGTKYQASILTLVGPLTSDEVTLTVNLDNVPPVALSAGAIKNLASGDDVGIIFSEKLAQPVAETIGNYTIAGGTVLSANYMASSPGVILRVTGLGAGAHSVNVKNVTDVKGNPMTTQDLPFTVSTTPVWGAVGGNEMANGFGKGYGVLPVGNGGFDVYSEGIGEWAAYDEATFVYEQVTGDFDKKLRVEFQDTASQWSRAGLIMREVTNIGVDRAAQEGGESGRYQKIHVNPTGPTLTGPGTAGNNSHEGNRRLDKGGQTSAPGFANNTSPLYPTAWVRLQRLGQTNNVFRSDDGIAWSYLGQTVWDIDSTVDGAMTSIPLKTVMSPL
jgi:hypothetical protein